MRLEPDLSGQVALVTGGTRGLGLAIALALGRLGARSWLTHRWGSADEGEIRARFRDSGAPEPGIVEADAGFAADTVSLLDAIGSAHDGVDVFVSNVCVAARGGALDEIESRDLARCLDYSVWPTASYLTAMRRRFGRLPGYVVATSSDGPDRHYPGYDYVAAAKAALEALCASLPDELGGATRVFVLRSRHIVTEGYHDVFHGRAEAAVAPYRRFAIPADEVARAVVAIVSGLLDGLDGQVLTLDRGAAFVDNVMTAATLLAETPA